MVGILSLCSINVVVAVGNQKRGQARRARDRQLPETENRTTVVDVQASGAAPEDRRASGAHLDGWCC